jgi:ankyrin repeat protein
MDIQDVFYNACRTGDVQVVERLLLDPKINPSAEDDEAIIIASDRGHVQVVERLLDHQGSKRVNPEARMNLAIICASANGRIEVVERLLKDPRVDPSTQDNKAIYFALTYGHVKVVRLLLFEVYNLTKEEREKYQEFANRVRTSSDWKL